MLHLISKFNTLQFKAKFFVKNIFSKPNLYNLQSQERLGCIYHEPSDMCETDRVMIYALVRGLKPKYALEIGTRYGNSARIIANAMQDNNYGSLVGIDPITNAFSVKQKDLHGRFKLYKGYSPEAIPGALKMLGAQSLDFVFIDGLHTHDAVRDDFNGVLPYLAPNAHVLFHDTYHQGINKAITDILANNEFLVDLGFMTRNPQYSAFVGYQGLRLVRNGKIDGEEMIAKTYEADNRVPPSFDDALRNYDPFANSIGKGATEEELKIINRLMK